MDRPASQRMPEQAGWLALAALPLLWLVLAGGRAFGPSSVDLGGHLWMVWSASRGPLTRTSLLNWPEGLDLMPVLGGWADVALGAALAPWIGLIHAYNLVLALYVIVAGLGGAALARALGARTGGAVVAGLLLQLDGFVLMHLKGGRPEQVGLGFVALALAGLLATARGAGRAAPWWTGLCGAVVVAVSWELALGLALAAGLLLPFLAPGARWRRLALAGGVCAALASPLALSFLDRAGAVRALDEGGFALETAARASIGLLGWFRPERAGPATLSLLMLVFLRWTGRAEDRWIWRGILLGLGLSLVLALGPWPGLWAPGDPAAGPAWGPFAAAQRAPLLGWFHWPDRLLWGWSLAAAAAAGLAVTRLGRWRGAALALALLAGAGGEAWRAGRWPRGELGLEAPAAVAALALRPEPGAVVDLPIFPDAARHVQYQILQMAHLRPILAHMVLGHLSQERLMRRQAEDPVLSWFARQFGPVPPGPVRFEPADFDGLRAQGFDFVALHRGGWPGARWKQGREALWAGLGKPALRQGDDWICWALGSAP